ncbi:hypothetical protein jhhlp_006136 [Lomentospora prolificans]|uniref:C2H2-type domain-containing protein n=1 Tax=Lomentospora prolificans TaxID=41688 RepID=A0A2N3N578_9PEZI|nr:hypothetical protein jhhlp_006136 [Lomentospora prolificans]
MSSQTQARLLGPCIHSPESYLQVDPEFLDHLSPMSWSSSPPSYHFDARFSQGKMYEQRCLDMSGSYSDSYQPMPSPPMETSHFGARTSSHVAFSQPAHEDYNTQHFYPQTSGRYEERYELGFVNLGEVAHDPYPESPSLGSYQEGFEMHAATEGIHMARGDTFSLASRTRPTDMECAGDSTSETGDLPANIHHGDGMGADEAVPGRGIKPTSPKVDTTRKRGRQGTKPSPNTSKKHKAITPSSGNHPCNTCRDVFTTNSELQDHVQQTHPRPLVCVFSYAGCTSTFGSKNEWKRHVLSQHIILQYWLCTDPACVRTNPESGGTIFNRKDLYTQHVRRMHVPEKYKETVNNKARDPEWDQILRKMQESAERKRCRMPTYMRCPAEGCSIEFRSATAWDDRMEHVAKHLDKAGEPRVVFGGAQDFTLTEWAADPSVNIVRAVGVDRWELVVPLKTTAKDVAARKGAASRHTHDSEEDADGEPE